jgi:serine/threonine protein kinase
MALTHEAFWKLLAESGLQTPAECQKLREQFGKGQFVAADAPSSDEAVDAAKWIVARRVITPYQAKILLSGRAGPFTCGPYQLRDRVTAGRHVGCFLAVHLPTNHPVFLWALGGPLAHDEERKSAAIAQLIAAADIVHPCLMRVYEIIEWKAIQVVAVEHLQGATAEDKLITHGPMGPSAACRVMRDVALAAAAMHAAGAPHGDIRPENVWVDQQGTGRLLQIPLSRPPYLPAGYWASALAHAAEPAGVSSVPPRSLNPPAANTSESSVARFANYAAPELAHDGSEADALSDVYAIGCTMYQLLSGRPPFAAGTLHDKLLRHATEPIEPLEPLGVPAELARVVAFAMAKDRRVRYQSPAELAEAFEYFVDPPEQAVLPLLSATAQAYEAWLASRRAVRNGAPVDDDQPTDVAGVSPSTEPIDDQPIDIRVIVDESSSHVPPLLARRRPKGSRNRLLFAAALLLAAVGGAGVGYVVSNRNTAEIAGSVGAPAEAVSDVPNPANGKETDSQPSAANEALLWASPTSGEPIAWRYLSPRAEALLALRPAQLLAHPEGEKLLFAAGPNGQRGWSAIEEAIGASLKDIESIAIAWTKRLDRWTPICVVRPMARATLGQVQARWSGETPETLLDQAYLVRGDRAFFMPKDQTVPLYVCGDREGIEEMISAGDGNEPLVRGMLKLWRTTDNDRLFTVVFTQRALAHARENAAAAGTLAPLYDAAQWVLTDRCRAAALSFHLDENFYIEARLVNDPQTTSPAQLAEALSQRLGQLGTNVEDYVSRIGLDSYSSRLLIRLGAMSRFVEQQLRVEAADGQVVVNAYLPAVAAHNLALGGELAIVRPGKGITGSSPPPSNQPPQNAPIAERLARPITVVQTGDTLEKALETIASEIGVPIEILGADFVSEGITRNNRFDVNAQKQPAAETLRAVLLKASPEGKLVYVVRPIAAGPETILITTRAAAQKRGDLLPAEFRSTNDVNRSKAR